MPVFSVLRDVLSVLTLSLAVGQAGAWSFSASASAGNQSQSDHDSFAAGAIATHSSVSPFQLGVASANATRGLLKVRASATTQAGRDATGRFETSASASFTESVMLVGPGLTELTYIMFVAFDVSGGMSASADNYQQFQSEASALLGWGASLGSTSFGGGASMDIPNGFRTSGLGAAGHYELEFVVGPNTPVPLSMQAVVSANAVGTPFAFGMASATADFGSTFVWGGVTALYDLGGQRITSDFSLLGESGFDYRYSAAAAPVPEPEAWISMLGGLAMVAGWRCRRQRHPTPCGEKVAPHSGSQSSA